MAGISMEDVSVSYGDKKVLKNISLEVKDGECFALLGPSACGKTTLARALCGFVKPDSGEIRVRNTIVSSRQKNIFISPEKRGIGVVFQDYAVWPHMTVYENVYYPLKKRRVNRDEAAKRTLRALEQVRMKEYRDRLPSQLSGGQQQRVAIARALVSSSDMIVLDEPITNLDANLREEMRFEIMELQRKNSITFLYITQDQNDALAISDRMAVMDPEGSIRQIGRPEDAFREPADSFVYRFLGVSNFMPVINEGNRCAVRTENGIRRLPFVVPENLKGRETFFMASRPGEIFLRREGSLKGRVRNVTFLGSMYDYRVMLGDYELRVQRDAHDAFREGVFRTGEECAVEFTDPRFYEKA